MCVELRDIENNTKKPFTEYVKSLDERSELHQLNKL